MTRHRCTPRTASGTRMPRRKMMQGTLASLLLGAPAVIIPGRARAAERLVVVNFGGIMGQAKQRALYEPFTRETGIQIVAVPGPSLAKLKLQVQSGNVEWDVVDLLSSWLPAAIRLGLLERIDATLVNRSGCIAQARSEYAIAGSIYAAGIGFTSSRFGAKVPQTWAEFWNTVALPGRRGLLRRVTDTLEIALLADGVPASHVYPCDVERGFRALDRIKPAVNHWIAQSEQTVSLIQQDETDFTFTYSTRVKNMQEAGAPLGFSFQQNLLGINWTGVVKGSSNRAAAMRLCAYVADPERQAALSALTGDAPTYPGAVAKVPPTVRRWLPDIGRPDNLFTDATWWDTRLEELTLRFQDWLFT